MTSNSVRAFFFFCCYFGASSISITPSFDSFWIYADFDIARCISFFSSFTSFLIFFPAARRACLLANLFIFFCSRFFWPLDSVCTLSACIVFSIFLIYLSSKLSGFAFNSILCSLSFRSLLYARCFVLSFLFFCFSPAWSRLRLLNIFRLIFGASKFKSCFNSSRSFFLWSSSFLFFWMEAAVFFGFYKIRSFSFILFFEDGVFAILCVIDFPMVFWFQDK